MDCRRWRRCSPPDTLEIRPYTAGFGAMVSGRRDDPADRPHIGIALDAARVPWPRGVGVRRPGRAPRSSNTATTVSPRDIARLSAGAELARELVGATAQVGPVSWSTSQHLSGTAPMGVDGDAAAVVDTQCRVRGVDNLWVVDGSVLPAITSRGPHATIVMIGHRAAEFVTSGFATSALRKRAAALQRPAARRHSRRSRRRPPASGLGTGRSRKAFAL